ncbi:MAG: UDP-3-O-(3-hydroxymyristoyl)glucosamine N-acyltransferase [Planctomycetes bacterium]|nr:UDP-3-O-(3-hydroxymyristoyl)glucosamine N-acyltransferase [Planctomycetota bacterium]
MTVTVRHLAELVRGGVIGDGELIIRSARTLEEAQAGDITFVESAKHVGRLPLSKASAAIVPPKVLVEGRTLIECDDPLMAFIAIYKHLHGKGEFKPFGIDPRADVHPSAMVGADPSIAPYVVIGEGTTVGRNCHLHAGAVVGKNCRIGDDVVLHPNVILYDDVVLGDRVILHAGAVVGADGFGYRRHEDRFVKVPQFGGVIIGSDVEIGACACIDRGTFEPTRIGAGTKIDNLVQIAHNVQLGKHNVLAAQVGIAGSCTTGSYVAMGGQAGVSDHVHIGDGAMIGAKTGVTNTVAPGKRMFLYPAQEHRDAHRTVACLRKLPEMRRTLLRVLKELNLLESNELSAETKAQAPAA